MTTRFATTNWLSLLNAKVDLPDSGRLNIKRLRKKGRTVKKNNSWDAEMMKKSGSLSVCIFAVIFFFVAGIAEAANWERISVYEDTVIYVDTDSIRHVSQSLTGAQFKIVFVEPSWVKSKAIDYYLIEQENDCREKKYKVYQLNVFFKDGTNETIKKKEEHDVNPDTFQSVIQGFVCKETK